MRRSGSLDGIGKKRAMRRTILFTLLTLFGLASCGGDDGGNSGPKPAAKLQPQITQLATSVCDVAFRCCARGEVDWYLGPYIDKENCAERFVGHASLSSK